jgi:hypothetical protein
MKRRTFIQATILFTGSSLLPAAIAKPKDDMSMIFIDAVDMKDYIGYFILCYNTQPFIAKLEKIRCEGKNKHIIEFIQVNDGKDYGKRFESHYDIHGTNIGCFKSAKGAMRQFKKNKAERIRNR